MNVSERKKPHILFVLEKWCDLNPECGESNNEHNLIGSLESSGLAITYDRFYYDRFWHKHHFSWGPALVKQCLDSKPDLIVLSWLPDNSRVPAISKAEIFNQMIREKMQVPIAAIWYDTAGGPVGDMFLPYVDLNVVLDSSSYLVTSSQPNRYLHLWTPQDSRIYDNSSLEKDIDVSFVGTVHREDNKNLYGDRRKGIDALRKAGIEVYQTGGQRSDRRLSAEEYARVFMRSKISLNFPRTGPP